MKHYINLFKSFFYAFRGILSTVNTERNMRIHLTCMIYMFSFLLLTDWWELTKGEWCAILLACALVISGEIVNTAIENVVDMVTKDYNEYAKRAKDAGSGAVLVSAIVAVVVGLITLYQPEAFSSMFGYFKENPVSLVLFILSIIPATLFIFFGIPIGKKK